MKPVLDPSLKGQINYTIVKHLKPPTYIKAKKVSGLEMFQLIGYYDYLFEAINKSIIRHGCTI